MAREKEFAWTGELPKDGSYVGYVHIKVEPDGVLFTVRSEGSGESASYKVPHIPARVMVGRLSDAMEG